MHKSSLKDDEHNDGRMSVIVKKIVPTSKEIAVRADITNITNIYGNSKVASTQIFLNTSMSLSPAGILSYSSYILASFCVPHTHTCIDTHGSFGAYNECWN